MLFDIFRYLIGSGCYGPTPPELLNSPGPEIAAPQVEFQVTTNHA